MIHRFGLEAGGVGQTRGRNNCGTHCGVRSAVHWRQLPSGLAEHSGHGEHRLSDHRGGARRPVRITKHEGTGGRVSVDVIKEQLLYELGDPKNYITPDCVADFTSIQLKDAGPDRVQVSGIRGGARPEMLKLSIAYSYGWKAIGTLVYSAPQALEKSKAADRIVRERLQQLGLKFEEIYTEFFGCQRVSWAGGGSESGSARGAIAHRRARARSESPRSLYARADPAGVERPADRYGFRRRPAAGAGGSGVLARADPARADPDFGARWWNEDPTFTHRARSLRRQGRHVEHRRDCF